MQLCLLVSPALLCHAAWCLPATTSNPLSAQQQQNAAVVCLICPSTEPCSSLPSPFTLPHSLVPPGYYIQSPDGGSTGQLAKCPNNISADGIAPASGFYRANWVAPSAVIDTDGRKGCTPCGEGVLSRPTAQDERTDLESLQQDPANPDPYFGLVASSPFSCCEWRAALVCMRLQCCPGVVCTHAVHGVLCCPNRWRLLQRNYGILRTLNNTITNSKFQCVVFEGVQPGPLHMRCLLIPAFLLSPC